MRCAYCEADVTPGDNYVRAASFREAYERVHGLDATQPGTIECKGHRYQVLSQLANGTTARVVLAQRTGPLPERVVIKLAHSSAAAGRLEREFKNLKQLQRDESPGSAYFSLRLPQPVAFGIAEEAGGSQCEALVLRHMPGFWGTLSQVRGNYPRGTDPRHAVWMWRRVLEVLGYIHHMGWVHGNLSSERLLVHPGDHGIMIIGWADAQSMKSLPSRPLDFAHPGPGRDLVQSAWTIRTLLAGGNDEPQIPGSTPEPLATLLKSASEDINWCTRLGANGIDEALQAAARTAFGPPKFVHFYPTSHI